MRVSRQEFSEHRELILESAARLFRERGLDHVGVAEIMQAAGLTHGGFYRHFESKDDLAAQACQHAFEGALTRLERRREDLPGYTRNYLTERHRDHPGSGCPIASFAADVAHLPSPVRNEFAAGLSRYLDMLGERLPRDRAIALVSSLVGALLLARATADASPELSGEVLSSMRAALIEVESAS